MKKARILLIDDEAAFCELCSLWLTQAGYEVVTCGDGKQALALFTAQSFDLVIHDLSLPPSFLPEEGLQLLPHYGEVPVVVITAHNEKTLALDAMRLGAWDFISKPIDPDLLRIVVQRAINKRQLQLELNTLKEQHTPADDNMGLLGVSPSVINTRNLIKRIANTEVPVLIQGPSGTGKEIIAKALHQHSQRKAQAFISVHCGAIPSELLESELFGYKKGAFTGADKDRKGLLSMADQGTLFLDEIGEMPTAMQVKLLRVLQEGCYYPVGGREVEHIDIRLVSATNRDLPSAVEQGHFRDDLYYRIKGVTIKTQALVERPEDLAILVHSMIQNANPEKPRLHISSDAMDWINQQPWPGNVRELKNTLESLIALTTGDTIGLQEIQFLTGQAETAQSETPDTLHQAPNDLHQTLEAQVTALEIRLISQALNRHQQNRTRAAAQLGLSRQGLLKKIARYGLNSEA